MIRKRIGKIATVGFPNHQKSRFGGALGLSLGSLGASWAVFVRLGGALGVHWVSLGTSKGVLEASWAYLGEILGGFLDVLGAFWESFGGIFGGFSAFEAIHENSKKPGKTNGFSLIFKVPGEFWGSTNE